MSLVCKYDFALSMMVTMVSIPAFSCAAFLRKRYTRSTWQISGGGGEAGMFVLNVAAVKNVCWEMDGISAPNAAIKWWWQRRQLCIRHICHWRNSFWLSIWCTRISAGSLLCSVVSGQLGVSTPSQIVDLFIDQRQGKWLMISREVRFDRLYTAKYALTSTDLLL